MSSSWQTLIDSQELAALLASDSRSVVFDCRHLLTAPEAGKAAWREAHIPGAYYSHLDAEQAGAVVPGVSGRHPLPDRDALAQWLAERGVQSGVQVVVYDDAGGAIAARLWWMLRWLGHHEVAVLNGGVQGWQALGLPMNDAVPALQPVNFEESTSAFVAIDVARVTASLEPRDLCLLDARSGERYRGEVEPFGPIAGHIPGAHSRPFADNLENGAFKTVEELQHRFAGFLYRDDAVCYCGSGVTGCHNILAMVHAGAEKVPALYTGSWSEWSIDSARPVATGATLG